MLAVSKLKAFADDKEHDIEHIKHVYHKIENIVGDGQNTCYQHLLLFPK